MHIFAAALHTALLRKSDFQRLKCIFNYSSLLKILKKIHNLIDIKTKTYIGPKFKNIGCMLFFRLFYATKPVWPCFKTLKLLKVKKSLRYKSSK